MLKNDGRIVKEQNPSKDVKYENILESQKTGGSFSNKWIIQVYDIPISIKSQFSENNQLDEIWTTLLALATLEIKFSDREDEWVLIYKKALSFLKSLGITNIYFLLTEAKAML